MSEQMNAQQAAAALRTLATAIEGGGQISDDVFVAGNTAAAR